MRMADVTSSTGEAGAAALPVSASRSMLRRRPEDGKYMAYSQHGRYGPSGANRARSRLPSSHGSRARPIPDGVRAMGLHPKRRTRPLPWVLPAKCVDWARSQARWTAPPYGLPRRRVPTVSPRNRAGNVPREWPHPASAIRPTTGAAWYVSLEGPALSRPGVRGRLKRQTSRQRDVGTRQSSIWSRRIWPAR